MFIITRYKFHKLKSHGVKTYWRCSTHLKSGCRAVLHTLEDTTIIGICFSEIKFIESQKGRRMILALGYRFRKTKVMGAKTHWKCSTHEHMKCRAVIHTVNDSTIIKFNNEHNH
ncbi:Modifier of mdg4 [Operophtera brumata]|uniref:Modifier of mdg4 n=1 Tax=Operophtera brumata TaxID=104452 RepID=A0A0L7LCC0_OPEBR|nr:Modifier of mdg4 [Operophtera brumata]